MVSTQTKVRLLLLALSLSILASLLYVSDVAKVFGVISGANPYYMLAAFALSVSLMFFRTFRWCILLEKIKVRTPFTRLLTIYMAGMFFSNLSPGKIGEPVKSYMLKKATGMSISKTLPSVFMERIFDVFSTVFLSFIGIALITLPVEIGMVLVGVVTLYLVGITAFIYVSSDRNRISGVSKKLLSVFKWFPFMKKLDKRIERFAGKFNKSLVKYKDAGVLAKSFAISMFIWCMEGFIFYLCFASIGINVDFFVVVSFLSIAVLIGVVSFLPGGIGSSEVAMILLFTTAYSLPIYSVTAAIFMARFFGMWMNIITGSLCMGSLKLHLTKI